MTENVGRLDAIDTEIALTALLASAVASYPRPGVVLYPLFKLIALSLLVITLVRRLAIVNGLTRHHRLLHVTTHLLDVATDNPLSPRSREGGTVPRPSRKIVAIV